MTNQDPSGDSPLRPRRLSVRLDARADAPLMIELERTLKGRRGARLLELMHLGFDVERRAAAYPAMSVYQTFDHGAHPDFAHMQVATTFGAASSELLRDLLSAPKRTTRMRALASKGLQLGTARSENAATVRRARVPEEQEPDLFDEQSLPTIAPGPPNSIGATTLARADAVELAQEAMVAEFLKERW